MTKIFEEVIEGLKEEYNKIPSSLNDYDLNCIFDHTKKIKEYPVGGYPEDEIPKQLQKLEALDLIESHIVHIKVLKIDYYYLDDCKQFLTTKEIVVFTQS